MKKGIALLITLALFLLGCRQQIEKQPILPKTLVGTSTQQKEEESVITEQILPKTGPGKPAPQLSTEERERLIKGTEIEAPPAR